MNLRKYLLSFNRIQDEDFPLQTLATRFLKESNEHSPPVSEFDRKADPILHRQMSLTTLIVVPLTDEELVEEISEDLLQWHERRGRILYGMCYDAFRSPEAVVNIKSDGPVALTKKFSFLTSDAEISDQMVNAIRLDTAIQSHQDLLKPTLVSGKRRFSCFLSCWNQSKRLLSDTSQKLSSPSRINHVYSLRSLKQQRSLPCMPEDLCYQKRVSTSSPGILGNNASNQIQKSTRSGLEDPGKLHVTIIGRGPHPIIIIHGMLSSSNFFLSALINHISPFFLQNVGTFYIADMMGYGKSVRILANENYGVSEQAARIYVDVVRRYSLEAYHMIAHSYGGMVAVGVAAIDPARVATLTLLSPSYFESTEIGFRVCQNAPFPCPTVTKYPELGRRILQIMTYLLHLIPIATSVVPTSTLTEAALRELLCTEPEATLGTVATLIHDRIDGWMAILRQHQIRILLLQADHDIIVPPVQGRKMALKFPNVIYRELQGTGHLFPQSHAALLAPILEHEVLRWISRQNLKLDE